MKFVGVGRVSARPVMLEPVGRSRSGTLGWPDWTEGEAPTAYSVSTPSVRAVGDFGTAL